MDRWCREYGLYVVLLLGVLAIEMVFSYGRLEMLAGHGGDSQVSQEEQQNIFAKVAMSSGGMQMPLALFGAAVFIIVLFGAGVVADVIFFMKWFLARSEGKNLLEPRPNVLGPWQMDDLLKLFIWFFFAISFMHGLLYLALAGQWLPEKIRQGVSLIAGTAGLYVFVLCILWAWVRHKYPGTPMLPLPDRKGIARSLSVGLSTYVAFIPMLAALMFMSLLLCQLLGIQPQPHEIVEILRHERSILTLSYLGLLTALLGPVIEEIVFRGVAYSALRKRFGIFGAAASSSLFFAMAHANAAQTLPVFGMGIVLAVLYEQTGSLLASITFHMLNNALAFGLTMFFLFYIK